MTTPTIPDPTTQAVQTQASTYNFTVQWYNFFAGLLSGPLGPTKLVGFTDGSNAAAGIVGEYVSNIVPFASGITMTTATTSQLASITLSAGDWDLTGEVFFGFPATATTTFYAGWLSNSNSVSMPGTSVPGDGFDYGQVEAGSGATGNTSTEPYTINGLRTRVNITTPTTYYLMGQINFSGSGTMKGYGALRARRMR